MKGQFRGITIILIAILLTLAYGDKAVFDFSFRWNTVFVLLGMAGLLIVFLSPGTKNRPRK